MSSTTIALKLDSELWDLVRPYYTDPDDAVREILVLEMYRRHDVSSGKAAELLGMGRGEFIRHTSRRGIPFIDMDERELADEIRRAEELG